MSQVRRCDSLSVNLVRGNCPHSYGKKPLCEFFFQPRESELSFARPLKLREQLRRDAHNERLKRLKKHYHAD